MHPAVWTILRGGSNMAIPSRRSIHDSCRRIRLRNDGF
jgi:hypothetical protein